MPLVNLKYLMDRAEEGKYAAGAFNCNNMEIVQAIVEFSGKASVTRKILRLFTYVNPSIVFDEKFFHTNIG